MKSVQRLIIVTSVAALAACTQTAPSGSAADQSAIRAVQNSWYTAFNAGDGAAVAALYADDAVLMAPGVPAARGLVSIQEYYAREAPKVKAAGLTAVEGATSVVGVSGDFGWQEDTYKLTDSSGASVESGKALTLFQRKDGKWKMIRDTWNSDAPATVPAVATAPTGALK